MQSNISYTCLLFATIDGILHHVNGPCHIGLFITVCLLPQNTHPHPHPHTQHSHQSTGSICIACMQIGGGQGVAKVRLTTSFAKYHPNFACTGGFLNVFRRSRSTSLALER